MAALPEIETSPAFEEAWGGTDTSELRASYLHAFRIAIYTSGCQPHDPPDGRRFEGENLGDLRAVDITAGGAHRRVLHVPAAGEDAVAGAELDLRDRALPVVGSQSSIGGAGFQIVLPGSTLRVSLPGMILSGNRSLAWVRLVDNGP